MSYGTHCVTQVRTHSKYQACQGPVNLLGSDAQFSQQRQRSKSNYDKPIKCKSSSAAARNVRWEAHRQHASNPFSVDPSWQTSACSRGKASLSNSDVAE
jgi:hypothetical protein